MLIIHKIIHAGGKQGLFKILCTQSMNLYVSSNFFGFTALLYKSISNMSRTEDMWLGTMRQVGRQLNSLSTRFYVFSVILKYRTIIICVWIQYIKWNKASMWNIYSAAFELKGTKQVNVKPTDWPTNLSVQAHEIIFCNWKDTKWSVLLK